MSRLTIVVLIVLVAGLGFLAWRQIQQPDLAAAEVPLFVDMDAGRVVKVHMENLEHAQETTFERDKSGRWMITDPTLLPAQSNVIEQLVQTAVARRGTPVDRAEVDMKKLGLDPPRVMLALYDDKGARQQLDIGAVDPDQTRVNVLAHGQVLRVLRDFVVLMDLTPEDYQSKAATDVDPRDVVELHRSGKVIQPGATEPTDVTLDALLEDGQWRATAPVVGLLDPTAIGLLLRGTAGLQFEHYTDNGDAPLSALGLDPPDLSFRLETVRGDTLVMRFGAKKSKVTDWWNGMTEAKGDTRHGKVWSVPGDVGLALATPVTDLLDKRLHRFKSSDIDAVQLSSSEREVRLQKGVFGWTVSEASAGSRVFGPTLPADAKKVSDFLIALDKVEVQSFLPGAAKLGEDEGHDAIHVRSHATSAGGAFGKPGEQGGIRFQRDGETVVGVVDKSVLDLARTTPQTFWSNSVVEIPEVDALQLTMRRGGDEIGFERDKHGIWVRKGRVDAARELQAVLDPLVFLRASSFLESTAEPLVEPIEVHWILTAAKKDLVVGILEKDGKRLAVCDFEGRRSVLQRQDLHELLAGLFQAAR
jgi:hypothetical protein